MLLARAKANDRVIFGVVRDETLIDLSSIYSEFPDLLGASRNASGRSEIEASSEGAEAFSLDSVHLLVPVARPQRILCVGTNYHDHVAESPSVKEAPKHPVIFTRFPSSLVGHGAPIVRPAASATFDFEGELAIIIGESTRHATAEDGLKAVAGYSCFMDGTIREYQRQTSQFTPGKNFDQSGAWGPWIVTADEVPDPYALHLETILDGRTVQSAMTSDMIFDIGEIVSYCSTFTTLEPGDVIATGTPGGVGSARDPQLWLTPGAELTVRISGVGELTNHVVAE